MALPLAAPERQLKHRRSIDVQIFARGDGLCEVDAHLIDTKTRDTRTAGDADPRRCQIDRCHAPCADGKAVRKYYPRRYKPAPPHNLG